MDYFFGEKSEGNRVVMSGTEMHHCLKVLRHKRGDIVRITNGLGEMWECRLENDDWKQESMVATILQSLGDFGESPARIILVVCGPEDPGRLEWLIEKSVELGVSDIWFTRSQRSGPVRIRESRIESILRSAVKQCGRSRIPKFRMEQQLDLTLKHLHDFTGMRLLGEATGTPLRKVALPQPDADLVICCGPEGDFSPGEYEMLKLNFSFVPVSLGHTRLRSETASVALLSWGISQIG